MAQFLIVPSAPPRRIVSGCSVYTTILASSGSSSGVRAVDGAGNAGIGVSSRLRVAGSIEMLANTDARKLTSPFRLPLPSLMPSDAPSSNAATSARTPSTSRTGSCPTSAFAGTNPGSRKSGWIVLLELAHAGR